MVRAVHGCGSSHDLTPHTQVVIAGVSGWGDLVTGPEPAISGMQEPRHVRAIVDHVDLNRVEKVIHQRYLSLVEREHLRDLRPAGIAIRRIAAMLNRSPSAISRELRRKTVSNRSYLPHTAHRLSVQRQERARQPKLVANTELHSCVNPSRKAPTYHTSTSKTCKPSPPNSTTGHTDHLTGTHPLSDFLLC